jgi:hypothetical protein
MTIKPLLNSNTAADISRVRGEWQITELARKYVKAFPHVKLGPGRAVSIADKDII